AGRDSAGVAGIRSGKGGLRERRVSILERNGVGGGGLDRDEEKSRGAGGRSDRDDARWRNYARARGRAGAGGEGGERAGALRAIGARQGTARPRENPGRPDTPGS